MNETTNRLGNLVVVRRVRCNRIEVVPSPLGYGLTTYWCATCGKDLEVKTTGAGFWHRDTWNALDREIAKSEGN